MNIHNGNVVFFVNISTRYLGVLKAREAQHAENK
jgi:hypothetical protein